MVYDAVRIFDELERAFVASITAGNRELPKLSTAICDSRDRAGILERCNAFGKPVEDVAGAIYRHWGTRPEGRAVISSLARLRTNGGMSSALTANLYPLCSSYGRPCQNPKRMWPGRSALCPSKTMSPSVAWSVKAGSRPATRSRSRTRSSAKSSVVRAKEADTKTIPFSLSSNCVDTQFGWSSTVSREGRTVISIAFPTPHRVAMGMFPYGAPGGLNLIA